jgi:hypothetical protein
VRPWIGLRLQNCEKHFYLARSRDSAAKQEFPRDEDSLIGAIAKTDSSARRNRLTCIIEHFNNCFSIAGNSLYNVLPRRPLRPFSRLL